MITLQINPFNLQHSHLNFTTGQFRLVVLDVGQGSAHLIQTQNHVLLYDTGDKWNDDGGDIGSQVILPYLRIFNIKKIDQLIISHADRDHSGGSKAVLENIPVIDRLTAAPSKLPFLSAKKCLAGQSWHWDGVDFTMLHPNNILPKKLNQQSCVLKISSANGSVLLTGDIDSKIEEILVKTYGKKLQANILLVPHHGSKTSSAVNFLQTVRPNHAIISSGFLNQYGHPAQIVLDRYNKLGIKVLQTKISGAITIDFKENNIEWRRERDSNPRWEFNPHTPLAGERLQPLGHLSGINKYLGRNYNIRKAKDGNSSFTFHSIN